MAGPPEPGLEDATAAKGRSTELALSRAQQTTARRMAESKATIPHLTLQADVEMEACLALQARLQGPTCDDMVVKAAALALREQPSANASYRDGRLQLHSRVNVAVSVADAGSLVFPTVFDADTKALQELAQDTRALAERVRAGTIAPPELSGATFSVSSLGAYGVGSFTAIINPPQLAILSVGSISPRAVVRAVVPGSPPQLLARNVVTLTLSCDHRVLYGADAALLLARIRDLLEAPAALTV